MLTHPTFDKLESLRLHGMIQALKQQWQNPEISELTFEQRLGLLVDREADLRRTRQMQTRLRKAKLRQNAVVEDIEFKHPCGLDRSQVLQLATCQWIKQKQNLLIIGPTGVGKSYLACAPHWSPTSQLPVEHWHEQIGDPTTADAILDRLVHNAHTLKLKGGSMRKKTPLTEQQGSK